MAKQTTPKKTTKKRAVSICLGCIEEFKNTELIVVAIHDKIGMKFQSVFCEKCVKEGNFPQHEKVTIIGPAAKPRKTRTKKETEKVAPKKKVTTKKKVTPKKK